MRVLRILKFKTFTVIKKQFYLIFINKHQFYWKFSTRTQSNPLHSFHLQANLTSHPKYIFYSFPFTHEIQIITLCTLQAWKEMRKWKTHVCTCTQENYNKILSNKIAQNSSWEDVNKTFNFRFSVSFTREIFNKQKKFFFELNIRFVEMRRFYWFSIFRLCVCVLWWVLLTFLVSITDFFVVANFGCEMKWKNCFT